MTALIPADDLAACRELIRTGSYSFHAASRLLPARVRDPALALYAFCRVADDEVDEVAGPRAKAAAVVRLGARLEAIYQGKPANAAADRAFAAVVEGWDMPRALPEALLEGFAWDATDRPYHSLSDVRAYAARVAGTVGAMMCVLMRRRGADVLARACDLGLAMQLTNIARDVGEDARAGRLFLPRDWMVAAGVDPARFMANPEPSPAIRQITKRLLREADRLYTRAEAGVAGLPLTCRPAIFAARLIYDGIGGQVARNGYDSVTRRAHTSARQKLGWLAQAAALAALSTALPRSAKLHARPEPEVAFLVDAAARAPKRAPRSDALIKVLAQLEAQDRGLA